MVILVRTTGVNILYSNKLDIVIHINVFLFQNPNMADKRIQYGYQTGIIPSMLLQYRAYKCLKENGYSGCDYFEAMMKHDSNFWQMKSDFQECGDNLDDAAERLTDRDMERAHRYDHYEQECVRGAAGSFGHCYKMGNNDH